jgi:hypothetical protein
MSESKAREPNAMAATSTDVPGDVCARDAIREGGEGAAHREAGAGSGLRHDG